MRNRQRHSNPVEWVAVEVAAVFAVVHRGTTVAFSVIPPTPEDSRPATGDSVSLPPDAVTTSPLQALPVSERGY